jgi:hypothetical protein
VQVGALTAGASLISTAGGTADLARARVRDAAQATTRAHLFEKGGEFAGFAGVPGGGEIGKVVAHLSYQEIRTGLRTQLSHYRAQIAAAVKPRAAALLAAGAVSRGVRRGISDDAVARLKELSGVP